MILIITHLMLPEFSKIFEKLLLMQLLKYLDKFDINMALKKENKQWMQ